MALIWSNDTLQQVLLASGWVMARGPQEDLLILPTDADASLLSEMLTGIELTAPTQAPKATPAVRTAPTETAAPTASAVGSSVGPAKRAKIEPHKSSAELKAEKEREALLAKLKAQKAEKARIRAQMAADRQQVATRTLRSSQSRLTNAG